MPSEKELDNPETKDYTEKYLKVTVPASQRIPLRSLFKINGEILLT
jgi:aromatic ring hydroxylase